MARPRVLYYVHTYFLDSCLETLQTIKNHVDIDLVIEVSPDSGKSTVFDLSDANAYSRLEKLEKILTPEKWLLFQPFLENTSSVEVLFFKGKSMLGIDSIMGGVFLGRLIRSRKYDVVHFDTASGRAISSLLFLRRNQLALTIHDPVPHVGEESLLLDWVHFAYTHRAKSILFYSYYSTQLYIKAHKQGKQNVYQLRLQPYSFIAQFKQHPISGNRHILFFGQLSHYKGIDLLLDAIPKVLDFYPKEHFVVAGKSNGFVPDQQYLEQYAGNISFIDEYLSIEKLSNLIHASKFVVCPYREATQSGVLMTAFAMGKTVLATNVGAFPEYISNGNDALLCNPDSLSIANGIISMLDSDHYLQLEQNIVPGHSKSADIQNKNTLMHVYQYSLQSNV
jgi:glycosyltransferase involved in cell wall biosynthesis